MFAVQFEQLILAVDDGITDRTRSEIESDRKWFVKFCHKSLDSLLILCYFIDVASIRNYIVKLK